jgi:hypothetical protein
VQMPPPYDGATIDAWGQSREQWKMGTFLVS